ncbi:MAG: AMP-binding protein [Sphingomonadales bacterium]|nr:AMP-binding protein [Sphingomonadales bacterium]
MMTETLVPTPIDDDLPRRFADFGTLGEALDYAARGKRGFNFHDPRGRLIRAYPFAELRDDAIAGASRLIAHGIEPGDRVALIADTEPQFCALFFAAVYAGALPVPLPLPTTFGGKEGYIEQLAVQLRSCAPKLLLYPEEIEGLALPAGEAQNVESIGWDAFAQRPAPEVALPRANSSDVCYLQYSSGSTRFPHGVVINPRRIGSQSRVAERFDLSRWRLAGNGADMIRPDVMEAFAAAFADAGFDPECFMPSYGLAEATLAVTLMPSGEGIVVDHVAESKLAGEPVADRDGSERSRAIVNCGKPVRDTRVEIRGDKGRLLAETEIGRVWIKSPAMMDGYFRDPEATAACIEDGWLDTGDMGYLRDGYLYIVGRAKDMIIVNGRNHWPQDIEWAVEQLPGFKSGDIAAFAITAPSGEETPAVLVQCRTSDLNERARLLDQIRQKVRAVTGMNCVIELVPPRTLPRTSSGKLSRTKARNLYLSGEIQPYDIAA